MPPQQKPQRRRWLFATTLLAAVIYAPHPAQAADPAPPAETLLQTPPGDGILQTPPKKDILQAPAGERILQTPPARQILNTPPAATAAKTSPGDAILQTPPGDAILTPAAPAQTAAAAVPVRIGVHAGYTRLVFDFPKLTAYTAASNGNVIDLTFATTDRLALPSRKPRLVTAFRQAKNENGLALTIGLQDGATYQQYRLRNKIVIDIFPAKKAAPKEDIAAVKPTAPRFAAAPKKDAAATPPAGNSETSEASDAAEVFDKSAPAPIAADTAVQTQAPDIPTSLTFTTLQPVRLAVFTRFKTLWVVMDTQSVGVQPPGITGPLAETVGKPRVTSFKGGTAYRFNLPDGQYVSARKDNANWAIDLTATPVQAPAAEKLNVQFDGSSGKAKLVVPLKGTSEIFEIADADVGDTLHVIAAGAPADRVDNAYKFANAEILPSAIGMAVDPLSDDIRINRIQDFVLISAPGGIIATPEAEAGPALVLGQNEVAEESRLFDFPNWRQGGIGKLNENRRALEARIAAMKTPQERSESLLKLALLYFANNFGQETLGVLRLVTLEDETMEKNLNYIALRGAASAMAGHYEDALKDLSNAGIQKHPEVNLWIGYVAAATEQWQMAGRSFPKTNQLLTEYPANIATPITLYMAESALRLGKTDTANTLLSTLDNMPDESDAHGAAATAYLKGEVARQEGRAEDAIALWKPVANGLDRLFHTKASLALANLELQEKKISLKEAIDRIDSLRFAWRGDGLEIQILHNLGLLKTQNGQFLAGLQDMKSAADLAETLHADPEPIENDIRRIFSSVFSGAEGPKISPLEAVSVYNEFGSLIPPGDAGSATLLRVADYLISIDLLEKAEGILEAQIAGGTLTAADIPGVGAKLAAVYLLDDRASQATASLDKTAGSGDKTSAPTESVRQERALLRARAQSQMNLTDDAINTLKTVNSKDATRLKADVLWRARKWDGAAQAIEALLPKPDAALTAAEAELVLNAAVAHKLSGNGPALADLKSRYGKSMDATPLAPTFSVVTRDGGGSALSDRDTILKIAGEVDMFKSFLDSYKAGDKKS